MKKVPAISVIVPVYKVELYVENSIRSVLNQTFKDFELIAIDDASPDRSIEIVRRLAREDKRLKLVRHEINRGLGAARNTGLEHARGKYVYFLDSDDLLANDALETFYRAAEQSEADVVHCTAYVQRRENEPGKFDKTLEPRVDPRPINGLMTTDRNVRLVNIYADFGAWVMVWLNFYRRDFLERNRLKFPIMLSEDEPFFIALLCLADRIFCIPDQLYAYSRRAESITKHNSSERASKGIAALLEGCRYISDAMSRVESLAEPTKSRCLQEFITRVTRNYILRRYDSDELADADAVSNFIRSLEPVFGDRSELAARLLQGLALQQLNGMMLANEQKTPSISVIIPVYKVERFVDQAVRSILNQTFKDIEVIAVDDASPDRSIEIINRLAQSDRRIELVRHEKNLGRGAARNTGLKHARGKYVYFFDCDDLLADDALETFYRAAEQSEADIVHSSAFFECREEASGAFGESKLRSDKQPVEGLIASDRAARLNACLIGKNFLAALRLNLFRRDLFERNKLKFLETSDEDESFVLALYCLAERFFCIPDRLCVHHLLRDASTDSLELSASGILRNDVFFNRSDESIRSIKQRLKLPLDRKLMIYAPTFRDKPEDNLAACKLDCRRLIETLEKKFGGRWTILLRFHPNVSRLGLAQSMLDGSDDIIDVTSHSDPNELLVVSDMLISDYSTTLLDFMLMRKPAFILARDLDTYPKERGFKPLYFKLPFERNRTEDELIDCINRFDERSQRAAVDEFMRKIESFDDGHASERVVDRIVEWIDRKELRAEPRALVEDLYRDEIRDGFLVDVRRKKLWNTQIEMILEVDRICRKHGLKWFVRGGTLIGAARHKGFIPWDDDVDLQMFRPDYEKFKALAPTELDPNYFFDPWYNYSREGEPNPENLPVFNKTSWPFGCTFIKIRDKRTTSFASSKLNRSINNGIGIDIMPLDPLPPFDKPEHEAFFEIKKELLIATEQPRMIVDAMKKNVRLLIPYADLGKLLSMPFKQRGLTFENYMATHYFESEYTNWFASFVWKGKRFKTSAFRETIELPFEQIKVPAPIDYDSVLTAVYGDWRTPVFTHSHVDVYSSDISYADYFAQVKRA